MPRLNILTAALLCSLAPAVGRGATAPAPSLETRFQSMISSQRIRDTIRDMTAQPTTPGTAFDKRNAEETLRLFRSWGWQAHIEPFTILFPHPQERRVELVAPTTFSAKLHEPPVAGDVYSETQQDEQIPPYFIYSPDGDVTAPVVYVNFGLRDDYAELARRGVSVKGSIVLIRYGRMWRGGKVELAAEHGAVGALLYSDPHEDGFYQGPTYPEGSWRSADAVQRGSVINGAYPGDPLSPGFASTPGAERLPLEKAGSLARIPSIPLSYSDALPFLAALKGDTVPESWRGALPATYRFGPGPAMAHLKVKASWDTITIYDVIATLPGSTFKDEWVVRGNHHDGWVYGAQDPHSGHAAMLEEARALGALYRGGWRPKRTIVYASWDAEEQGTIGSTEWMEAHLPELRQKAVAYLNSDVIAPGTIHISGSQSLQAFATDLARAVPDPQSGRDSLTALRQAAAADRRAGNADSVHVRMLDDAGEGLLLAPPGYGSDHAAFVERSGVPVLTLEFGGDMVAGGAYHSSYDNFAWFDRFGDPGYRYTRAAAQLNGTAVIRLADADVLPFRFTPAAQGLSRQADLLRDVANERDAAAARNGEAPPPALDLEPLDRAIGRLAESAARADAALASAPAPDSASAARALNRVQLSVEQGYLRAGGLPDRPQFLNEFYSPGRLWDDVPVPAVGDPLLDGKAEAAQAQVAPAAATVDAIVAALDKVTALAGVRAK